MRLSLAFSRHGGGDSCIKSSSNTNPQWPKEFLDNRVLLQIYDIDLKLHMAYNNVHNLESSLLFQVVQKRESSFLCAAGGA